MILDNYNKFISSSYISVRVCTFLQTSQKMEFLKIDFSTFQEIISKIYLLSKLPRKIFFIGVQFVLLSPKSAELQQTF